MVYLRDITYYDLDTVYSHLCELATTDGILSSDFSLTKERFTEELLSDKSDWYGIVAVTDKKKVIGSCLYNFTNTNRPFNRTSCLFIDTLFVEGTYRRLGIASIIMSKLLCIASDKKISRIEFWCLKSNLIASEFYQNINAKKNELLDVYTIKVSI